MPAVKMKKHAPTQNRSLPTLVVLPVPSARRYTRQSSAACPLPSKGDVYKQAIVHSADSLCAVIDLTLSFLDAEETAGYLKDVESWLLELRACLDVVEGAMHNGEYDGGRVTIDTEGPADLDAVLCRLPEADDHEAPLNSLSRRMLDFWLKEVERRGWELFHICIQSVDCVRALKLFQEVLTMTPEYMEEKKCISDT